MLNKVIKPHQEIISGQENLQLDFILTFWKMVKWSRYFVCRILNDLLGILIRTCWHNFFQKLMIDEKKCYFFGRNKQLCDFCIDHASSSRVHAALVWHKFLERPFLIDLGSSKFFVPFSIKNCNKFWSYSQNLSTWDFYWQFEIRGKKATTSTPW